MATRYIGKLGDDSASRLHARAFADAGVLTEIITVPDCSSRQSIILVDGEGERTVLGRKMSGSTFPPPSSIANGS